MLVGQHAPHRLLRHQESAERADRDGLRHIRRHQIDKRAARPRAGVVDHHVGAGELAFDRPEQALDLVRVGGVAGKGARIGFTAQRAELSMWRAASATRSPSLANSRASDALMPSPAPTISAVL